MDEPDRADAGELRQRLADRLKELTNRSGYSVRDLEKKTTLSKSTVQDALRGEHFPRLETVVKIVQACAGDEESWRTEWAEVNGAIHSARRKHRAPHWRRPAPRQLPATVADFVGRRGELDMLTGQLDSAASDTVAITTIEGTAGVGKTALALCWGNRMRDRFPDGQLYVDLHGYGPGQPRRSGDALALLLGSLGVPATQVPADVDECAALYRSLLAGKKMLVVLDNAAAPEQVRPLLPGSPGCQVIVTSRGGLPGLVAGNGARQLILDRLAPAEAATLLRRVIGPAMVDADPDAVAEIARRCAYLPLALRVAAQRALASAPLSLAEIADQLAAARLDLLATSDNDESTNVRAVFSWSYRALPTPAARLFRLLGLHAGPEISLAAAAALGDTTGTEAEQLLEVLAGAHLLERAGTCRYRFHDLLRDYAAEQAVADEPEPERDAAVRRVLNAYLSMADAADRVLSPDRLRAAVDGPPPDFPVFTDYGAALEWFDVERANLTAATRQAAEAGLDDIAWKIPVAMSVYCYIRKPWADWVASHQIGLAAARRCHETFGEAAILTGLGAATYELRQYQSAVGHLHRAHTLWREIGHQWGEAIALNILGSAHRDLRQFEQAISCFRQALDIWPEIDHTWGKGVTLHNLGTTYRELGDAGPAITWLHQSIEVRRAMPDRYGEAWAIHDLGIVHADLHQYDEAVTYFNQALSIRQEIGDVHGQAQTHYELSKTLPHTEHPADAETHLRQALALFDNLHDPRAAEVRARLKTS